MTPVSAVPPVTPHVIIHADELEALQARVAEFEAVPTSPAAAACIVALRLACMAADTFLHTRCPQLGPEERALCERLVAVIGDSFAIVPEGQTYPIKTVAGLDRIFYRHALPGAAAATE